jgi:hypothetical protein
MRRKNIVPLVREVGYFYVRPERPEFFLLCVESPSHFKAKFIAIITEQPIELYWDDVKRIPLKIIDVRQRKLILIRLFEKW